MTPATGTALLVIAAFVLPGFVTLLMSERTHAIKGEDTPFERLLVALYYSGLIYAVVVGTGLLLGADRDTVAAFFDGDRPLEEYLAVGAAGLLVLPFAIAEAGLLWRRSTSLRAWVLSRLRISPTHSTPSGWDHFFQQNQPALVRATLTDGRVVGGYFSVKSFAGYSDHHEDLFLERRWELDDDDWFVQPVESSLGLWIASSSIVSFEVYEAPEPGPAEPPTQ